MNRELAKRVADAVLYEGYMLYPYRPSALKNRQRWTFGILYPRGYEEVRTGTERAMMHSECVLVTDGEATLHVHLRFLHLVAQQVTTTPETEASSPRQQACEAWDEGQERTVDFQITIPFEQPVRRTFSFGAVEGCRGDESCHSHFIRTVQQEISGAITVSCERARGRAIKLVIEASNESSLRAATTTRDDALQQSLLSAHLILSVEGGEFVSLLDPSDEFRATVGSCRNVGNFPVLIGSEGERDMMLCSPILLYDYPQIAPESAGDFYDATEMDEMLTLRVMTLTDAEKQEVRLADEHARNLLERTERTVREQLQKTHGAIRSMRSLGGKS